MVCRLNLRLGSYVKDWRTSEGDEGSEELLEFKKSYFSLCLHPFLHPTDLDHHTTFTNPLLEFQVFRTVIPTPPLYWSVPSPVLTFSSLR